MKKPFSLSAINKIKREKQLFRVDSRSNSVVDLHCDRLIGFPGKIKISDKIGLSWKKFD